MKTQQENIKKWCKTCRSLAWCFANVLMSPRNSTKWLISKQQTSSKLPGKFHHPYAWRSKKWKSLRFLPQRSRGVPQRVPHGGTVDTEAAAAVAAEDVHSIGHVAPDRCAHSAGCGRRSAREQLTPAIGLAKVAEMYWNYKQSIDLRWLRKIQSRFWLYKNGVGHLPAIYLNSCLSSFLTSPLSLRWV